MSLIQLVYLWSIIGILHLGNQSYAVPLLSIRTSLACIWFKQYSINATNGGGTMATLAQNHIEITNPILIKNNKYAKHILSHTVKEEVFHSRLKFWYLAYQVGSNHCHPPLKILFSCLCPPFPPWLELPPFGKYVQVEPPCVGSRHFMKVAVMEEDWSERDQPGGNWQNSPKDKKSFVHYTYIQI